VDGAGGEPGHPGLTATYSYGYFSEGIYGEDNYPADAIGCGVRIPGEEVVGGVFPDDASVHEIVPAAIATALRFPVTAATPYSAHFRKSTLGRAVTVARLGFYGRMRGAVLSNDQAAFEAAQRELLVDLARVSHHTRRLDIPMRNAMNAAMRSMPQYAGRFTPPDIPMPPVEPEPWSFRVVVRRLGRAPRRRQPLRRAKVARFYGYARELPAHRRQQLRRQRRLGPRQARARRRRAPRPVGIGRARAHARAHGRARARGRARAQTRQASHVVRRGGRRHDGAQAQGGAHGARPRDDGPQGGPEGTPHGGPRLLDSQGKRPC